VTAQQSEEKPYGRFDVETADNEMRGVRVELNVAGKEVNSKKEWITDNAGKWRSGRNGNKNSDIILDRQYERGKRSIDGDTRREVTYCDGERKQKETEDGEAKLGEIPFNGI